MKQIVALVVLLLMLGAVAWWILKDRPEADSPYADAMLGGMLPRIVATATGIGLFAVAGPITLITRPSDIGRPFEWLIMKPIRYTWVDPIGDHASPTEQ